VSKMMGALSRSFQQKIQCVSEVMMKWPRNFFVYSWSYHIITQVPTITFNDNTPRYNIAKSFSFNDVTSCVYLRGSKRNLCKIDLTGWPRIYNQTRLCFNQCHNQGNARRSRKVRRKRVQQGQLQSDPITRARESLPVFHLQDQVYQ